MVRIEEWSIGVIFQDAYTAPETLDIVLRGMVYGHPNYPDGESLRSSPIVLITGREVVTYTGRHYLLGKPHPDYVAWCIDNGKHDPTADPDEPVIWTSQVAEGGS